jgi:ADP-ribose pyrophosphatase
MPEKNEPKAEKTIKSQHVFKGQAINLRVDDVITADGRRTTREIVEHPGAVVVVALDADDNVLLVHQYRTGPGKNLLEIPAGSIDKGETPEQTVVREMQEETGFKPRNVKFITGFYSTPGFSNEYLRLYLATDLVPSRLTADDTAGIDVVRVPLTEVKELVTSGKIEDAKTIAGLLLLMLELRSEKLNG